MIAIRPSGDGYRKTEERRMDCLSIRAAQKIAELFKSIRGRENGQSSLSGGGERRWDPKTEGVRG